MLLVQGGSGARPQGPLVGRAFVPVHLAEADVKTVQASEQPLLVGRHSPLCRCRARGRWSPPAL